MGKEPHMDENLNPSPGYEHLTKWLGILFAANLASLIVPLFSYLPMETGWITWVQKAITLCSVICLFQLTPGGIRYRRAAICRAVVLGCSLVNGLVIWPIQFQVVTGSEEAPLLTAAGSILNLAVMVFSWVATYQEYTAHADLIAPADPALAKKWHRLFWWGCAAALFATFGSMIVATVAAKLEIGVTTGVTVATSLVQLPDEIISIVYLIFLNRMIRLFRT